MKFYKKDGITFRKMRFPNSTSISEGILNENKANYLIHFYINSTFAISNVSFLKNNVTSKIL